MSRSPKPVFFRRILELRVVVVVNVLILFFIALAFGKEFMRNYSIQSEINALQVQSDELKATNIELTQLNTALHTQAFLEREARLKLGLQKPGEQLVIIDAPETGVRAPPTATTPPTTLETYEHLSEPAAVANPQKWWYYFFDRETFEAVKAHENIL